MSVVEKSAAFGESIDVRGFGIWVTVHASDPVVLIIDSDEENVGLLGAVKKRRSEKNEN